MRTAGGGSDMPEEIETNTAKTTVVRVRCPPKASLAEFEALIRAWVDHQCILLADFKGVSKANPEGLFAGQPILPHTSPRGRNSPGRLLQFRGRLKAQKEMHPLDQSASAIAPARVT
jgi:hypothetical protein